MQNDPIHIDYLTVKSGFDLTKLLNLLLTLELKGASYRSVESNLFWLR